jgi:hypothetical protein
MIPALLAAVVLLADGTPAAQPQAKPAASPGAEVVCRTESEFGTRLTRKVCRSPSEDRQRRAQARSAIDPMQAPAAGVWAPAGAVFTPMTPATLMSPAVGPQHLPAH